MYEECVDNGEVKNEKERKMLVILIKLAIQILKIVQNAHKTLSYVQQS